MNTLPNASPPHLKTKHIFSAPRENTGHLSQEKTSHPVLSSCVSYFLRICSGRCRDSGRCPQGPPRPCHRVMHSGSLHGFHSPSTRHPWGCHGHSPEGAGQTLLPRDPRPWWSGVQRGARVSRHRASESLSSGWAIARLGKPSAGAFGGSWQHTLWNQSAGRALAASVGRRGQVPSGDSGWGRCWWTRDTLLWVCWLESVPQLQTVRESRGGPRGRGRADCVPVGPEEGSALPTRK